MTDKGIWACQTLTIDIPEGTPLTKVIKELQDWDEFTPGLIVPNKISLAFGTKTKTEFDEHYKIKEWKDKQDDA